MEPVGGDLRRPVDSSDRSMAIGMWLSTFVGMGPLVALLALVLYWSQPSSVARREGRFLLLTYLPLFLLYVVLVTWGFMFGNATNTGGLVTALVLIALMCGLAIWRLVRAIRLPKVP